MIGPQEISMHFICKLTAQAQSLEGIASLEGKHAKRFEWFDP